MRTKFMGPTAQAEVGRKVEPEPMRKPTRAAKEKLDKYMDDHEAAYETFL